MRLIDADDLFSRYVSLLSKHIAEFKLGDAIEMLEDAPTVDAIPIEWLKAWSKMYLEPTKEYTDIIEDIINDWREEAEQ